jgi:hypothetical protein
MELPEIYAVEKAIVSATEWIERDAARHSDLLTMIAHLEIDGASIPGLRLRGTAIRNMPDRAVTFQIEYHRPRQHGAALARVEWIPVKGHNNKGLGPKELQFILIPGTHIHPFDLNWKDAQKHLKRGNLPIAMPLALTLNTFAGLLDFVGKEFRIKGLEDVSQPEWQPDLVR